MTTIILKPIFKTNRFFLLSFLLLFIPQSAYANEPLVPLIILFVGPTFSSVFFASFFGLILVIVLKSAVFLWKSDFKSPLAIYFVIIANIVSTFIGIIVAGMFTSSFLPILCIPILYLIFFTPARRLKRHKIFARLHPWFIAFLLTLLTYFTVFIFGIMMGFQTTAYIYWPLKILMAASAILVSLLISVLYEEAVISKLYRVHRKVEKSFLEPVLWCNIIAFAVVMLIGAIVAFPKRLASPDFLIRLIDALKSFFC